MLYSSWRWQLHVQRSCHQLYGNDNVRMLLQYSLQEILASNVNRYACNWIGPGSFTDHVKQLRKSGKWGTQVELQLASDVFQIPVYISAPSSEGFYRWNVFKPKELNISEDISNKLKLPVYPFCAMSDHHVEMAHNSSKIHYDSVVPINKERVLHYPCLEENNCGKIELD